MSTEQQDQERKQEQKQERKRCGRCREWLSATADNFHRSGTNKSGWRSYCKPCLKKYNQKYHKGHYKQTPLSKGREVYDPQIHGDDLNPEQEMLVREAGIAPDGWYICSRCEHVKPNDIKYFPLQPGKFRTKDGERKFGIICKTCRRKAKRHAKHRRRYEKEMAGIQWDTSIPEEYNQVEVDSRYRQKVAEHELFYKRDPRIY